MLPILQLGPLAVQVPGLVLLAGVWAGVEIVEHAAPRRRLDPGKLSNMIFLALVAGLLGARLVYAFRFLDVYLADPLSLLSLNSSTLSPVGGLLASGIAAAVYGQRKGLPLWDTLDTFSPGLAGFMVFLSLANWASGDAFGAPANVPWAVELWGAPRHPTQLYSAALALAVLVIVWRLRDVRSFPGFTFLLWVLLASGSRLLVEAFRGDSVIVFGFLRQPQAISIVLMAASLIGLRVLAERPTLKP